MRAALQALIGVLLIGMLWAYVAAINYPAVVVQAWMFWFDSSLANGLLLMGAAALSILARYCGAGGNLGRGNLLARWYVEDRGALTIVPIEALQGIVTPRLMEDLREPFSLVGHPTQWIVCMASESSRRSTGQVVTYRSLLRACITFLPDTPERLTVFQRFCVLRAAAQCALGSRVIDREGQQQVWLWSVPWLALLADWSLVSAMPLIVVVGVYWRLHVESDWLRQATGDVWVREESMVDTTAAQELSDAELVEIDECLAEYVLEDGATRATVSGDMLSALQNVVQARYFASLEFSGGVRTLALRDQIKWRLDPPGAQRQDSPANKRLTWEQMVPIVTVLVSVAIGACVALFGQRHTPLRFWAAGVLVTVVAINAAVSWRYVFRARRRLLAAIRAASDGT